MLKGMKLIRPGVWVALVLAVLGIAVWARLAPARADTRSLDSAQGGRRGSGDDCMPRARRALPAEGWAIGGEYGAPERGGYFVAWQGNHGVILVCDIEPAGGSIFHMTMSGLDEGNR